MRTRLFIKGAHRLVAVVGVLLIALVVVACRHGAHDIGATMKSSLLNVEATLRDWFSCLQLR